MHGSINFVSYSANSCHKCTDVCVIISTVRPKCLFRPITFSR